MVASTSFMYSTDSKIDQTAIFSIQKRGTKRSSPDALDDNEYSPKRKVSKKESIIFNGAPTSKKNKIAIPVHDIVRLLTVPQPVAAKALNVSVSTLKRRFYELSWGRWPCQVDASTLEESTNRYEQERSMSSAEKAKIVHVTHQYNTHSCTSLDSITYKVLQCAFKSAGDEC
jgi:hypothetical protein